MMPGRRGVGANRKTGTNFMDSIGVGGRSLAKAGDCSPGRAFANRGRATANASPTNNQAREITTGDIGDQPPIDGEIDLPEAETEKILVPRIEEIDEEALFSTMTQMNQLKSLRDKENFEKILEVVKAMNRKKFKFMGDGYQESVSMHKQKRVAAMIKMQKGFNKMETEGGPEGSGAVTAPWKKKNEVIKPKKRNPKIDKLEKTNVGLFRIVREMDENIQRGKPFEKHNCNVTRNLIRLLA
jgi:hypothetical protein